MYNRAEENSAKLEATLNLQEQWMERGDQLLYAMLPRQVAQVLRGGQHPLDTCQVLFEGGGGAASPRHAGVSHHIS